MLTLRRLRVCAISLNPPSVGSGRAMRIREAHNAMEFTDNLRK